MKIWKLHTTKIRRGKKEKEHIFEVKIFKSKFDWHHLKYKLKQNRIKIFKIQIGPKQCEEVLREKKWMKLINEEYTVGTYIHCHALIIVGHWKK